MKTALIFGASGLVGSACLTQLLASKDYDKVISIGRSELALQHDKLSQHVIEMNTLSKQPELFNVDHLYCCLGTTLKKAKSKQAFAAIDLDLVVNIAKLAKEHDVATFSVISSLGANPNSLNYYSATKGKMEQAIIDLGFEHTVIVRPCLLLGQRQEFRPLEHFCGQGYQIIKPLFVGPLAKIKPIEVEKVAQAMIHFANQVEENASVHIVENSQIHQLADNIAQ